MGWNIDLNRHRIWSSRIYITLSVTSGHYRRPIFTSLQLYFLATSPDWKISSAAHIINQSVYQYAQARKTTGYEPQHASRCAAAGGSRRQVSTDSRGQYEYANYQYWQFKMLGYFYQPCWRRASSWMTASSPGVLPPWSLRRRRPSS